MITRMESLNTSSRRYVESPPAGEDEAAALAQLLDACLGGAPALHGALAAALCSVSSARAGTGRPVLVAERPLDELVADGIGALKLRVRLVPAFPETAQSRSASSKT